MTKRLGAMLAMGMLLSVAAAGVVLAQYPRSNGFVDLEVAATNITLFPANGNARLGDNLTISAVINNFGDTNATNVTVVFYNTTVAPSNIIGTYNFTQNGQPVINVSSNGTANCFWNTTGLGLQVGVEYTLYMRVFNDTGVDQNDTFPLNNLNSTTVTFLSGSSPYVVSITTSADDVIVGDTVNLLATLNNNGPRNAVQESVSFYLDNATAPFNTTVLDINVSTPAYAPLEWNTTNITDGPHNVTVSVRDSLGTTSRMNFKYRVNPCLVNISSSAYSGNVGDNFFITANVRNSGAEDAGAVVLDFYLDAGGVAMGNRTAEEILPGGDVNVTFLWDSTDAATGNHSVKARIRGTAKEMRTGNITLTEQIFPDLTISNLWVSNTAPVSGDIVTVRVNITNIGPKAPKTNVTFQMLLDSVETVNTTNITPPGPGQSVLYEFQWDTRTVRPGSHSLLAWVDPEDAVFELDEMNNDLKVGLEFAGTLDLRVNAITFSYSLNQTNSTTVITARDVVNVWISVSNAGSLASLVNTTLGVYLDGGASPIKVFTIHALSAGGSYTATFEWNATAFNDTAVANHSMRAAIDPEKRNNDTDWTNNNLTVNLTVNPWIADADITVIELRLSKTSIRYEEILLLTAHIANLGGKTANNVSLLFSYQAGVSPQPLQTITVPFILPGEHLNRTFNWTVQVAEGNYTVSVTLDPRNAVDETNKTNNQKTSLINVLPAMVRKPDLRITAFTSSASSPKKGQTVSFNVTVRNVGDAAASGLTVSLLIDGKSIQNLTLPSLDANAERTLTLSWKATDGSHSAGARVTGAGVNPVSSPLRSFSVSTTATEGSMYPIIIVIIALIMAAVLLVAKGSKKEDTQNKEEE